LTKVKEYLKKNIVTVIAFIVAIVTGIMVPPDREYMGYFDFKTLSCLFATLAVVCALRNIRFFRIIAAKIVSVFKNIRSAIIALVYITFIGSMLIANDMALITFLPLGYYVLKSTDNRDYMAFTFIMQNIAANLGGMLTPFGNPQNLYLYTYFNISNTEFVKIMFLPFIIAITLITACCMFVEKKPLVIKNCEEQTLDKKKTAIYIVLFAISIAMVFNLFPYYIGLIFVFVVLMFMDRKALIQVDYGLLLTFCAFFVFSGNMARIPAVYNFLGSLIEKNTLLYGFLSCQAISNVPSAILLSKFTQNYQQLLVAVNIGGAGTLISSLASLITFKEFIKHEHGMAMHYIKLFTVYNFGISLTLLAVMAFVFR